MNKKLFSAVFFLLILNTCTSFSQEWRNLRSYKKATNKSILCKGCWLKKDRKKDTEIWKKANTYNLSINNGYLKYQKISQIRDFYRWFDQVRKKNGHEIISVGIMAVVATQFSKIDNYFIRKIFIRNKEIIWFANQGSKNVLKYYFPLLKNILFSEKILKGERAKQWDVKNTKIEQCQIVTPLYEKLSIKSARKLGRMAKGKGIFCFGIKKAIRFEGNIESCQSKYEHALFKLKRYYLNQ
ncbi:hypothetical protein F7646_08310 [Tenacibaculum finnmarkense genomovar finnmarkense]|uniref:hypothetical protein n=1 Tax=Tenacibaculum finnmarkense TaxID=2781243 RepID=UPI00187B9109|nr:hypothetical protein [Tenacibaculum finnmarkense]MBE7660578.1 hypothetical protein [Tenacibaculum finnmarkense genomovar finnmarkense]